MVLVRRQIILARYKRLPLTLMKLRSILALLAVGLAVFAGCGKRDEKIKLGYLVTQPEEPWFQYEWKGAEKAAAQYGFEVVKLGVPDTEKVIAAIDNLTALHAKGFVICTPDVRLGPAIA